MENLKSHLAKDGVSPNAQSSKRKDGPTPKTQILTHLDVEQIIENLLTDQFKEEPEIKA